MDRLPHDALSLIVEALRPCERKAVRQVSRAWRQWPCRPRRKEQHQRPSPVIHVAVHNAMYKPLNGPKGPLRMPDPSTGKEDWWWGMACRTVVVEPGPTALPAKDKQDIHSWLFGFLAEAVPGCTYLVIDCTLCRFLEPGLAWPQTLSVILSATPLGGTPFPVEIGTAADQALAPWGLLIAKPEPAPWLHGRGRRVPVRGNLHGGVSDSINCVSAPGSVVHASWHPDAPTDVQCEALTAVVNCEPSKIPAECAEQTRLRLSFPRLRSLRIQGGLPRSSLRHGGSSADAAASTTPQSPHGPLRDCIGHLAAVIVSSKTLQSVHVDLRCDDDLAAVVNALNRRELKPVELYFTGSQQQLFTLVMGCDASGKPAPGCAFLRRRFVFASITMRCKCPAQALHDLIAVYESNARALAATTTALRSLVVDPVVADWVDVEASVTVQPDLSADFYPWRRKAMAMFPVAKVSDNACLMNVSSFRPACLGPVDVLASQETA